MYVKYKITVLKNLFRVNTNHGKFVKLVPDTFDLPCLGNNGLVIEDVGMGYSGAKSVSFCGKKNIPAFVSSDVKFEIHLTIDDPGPVNLIVFKNE